MSTDSYVLGRSAAETQRLHLQGQIYGSHTEHLLRSAGLTRGMRVLDIGCGVGDVTLAAARLVGPSGEVIGVDADASLLAVATDRAAGSGMENVSFIRADIPDIPIDGEVDALIGRLILIHLEDPVGAIRALRPLVRPGGIIAFQDFGLGHTTAPRTVPLAATVSGWGRDALRASGHPLLGSDGLVSIYRDAGLSVSGITAVTSAASDPESPLFDYLAATIGSLLPAITAHGIATEAEVEIDTLADRLRADARETGALLHVTELVGVWATEPERN
ncbi:MAG TPA: methyltransferase domain-containing protein [Pseudonocardiaceae bacterium]|nr:methyltransferase domain-containing protein [Pseudonocardiaceae bacterium]